MPIWFGSNGGGREPYQRVLPVRGPGQWIPSISDANTSQNRAIRARPGKLGTSYEEH
jgi:hypothetical protein